MNNRYQFTKEQYQEMLDMRAKNITLKDIAMHFNVVSSQAMLYIIRQASKRLSDEPKPPKATKSHKAPKAKPETRKNVSKQQSNNPWHQTVSVLPSLSTEEGPVKNFPGVMVKNEPQVGEPLFMIYCDRHLYCIANHVRLEKCNFGHLKDDRRLPVIDIFKGNDNE